MVAKQGGPLGGIAGLKNARAHKDALGSQLHHQSRVSGGSYAAGSKVDHRQLAVFVDVTQQVHRNLELLGGLEQFVLP